jgi:cytochrome P450
MSSAQIEPVPLTIGPDIYRDLRSVAEAGRVVPVLLHGTVKVWFLTRAADIAEAAVDPRLSVDDAHLAGKDSARRSSVKLGLMAMDGPAHLERRRILMTPFGPRQISRLAPRVQLLADELVSTILPAGRADLVNSFFLPLSLRVICELLGIPLSERPQFEEAVNKVFLPSANAESAEIVLAAREELYRYFADLMGRNAPCPENSLLALLKQEESITPRELIESATLILVTGYETTANFLSNALLVLMKDPKELRLLRDHPGKTGQAVEELLRYRGPVATGPTRYTREEVVIGGVHIPAGERVILGFGCANHDPSRFEAPDQLNIEVRRDPHFAFGRGPHYCLGAALAKVESEVAIRTIVDRLMDLELDGEPVWRSSFLHGLEHLPVRYRSSSG